VRGTIVQFVTHLPLDIYGYVETLYAAFNLMPKKIGIWVTKEYFVFVRYFAVFVHVGSFNSPGLVAFTLW
jgi:hypothetical protein